MKSDWIVWIEMELVRRTLLPVLSIPKPVSDGAGSVGEQLRGDRVCPQTPSTAFRHLSPNSARFGYGTERALYISADAVSAHLGAGIAQWLEHRTRDWKVAGSNPCWNGGRIFFSRVDFLCWLLFRYPFHPRVTTVARKKSRSFCQKVQVAGYS